MYRFFLLSDAGLARLRELTPSGIRALNQCDAEDINRTVALKNMDICPFTRKDGQLANKEFYDRLGDRMQATKQRVIVMGQGIVGDNEDEVKYMRNVVDAVSKVVFLYRVYSPAILRLASLDCSDFSICQINII